MKLLKSILISQCLCYILVLKLSLTQGTPLRKSCGSDLHKRIASICEILGGYNVFKEEQPHHRVRRRVADECCKRACSDAAIRKYCSNDIQEEKTRDIEETPLPIGAELNSIDKEKQYLPHFLEIGTVSTKIDLIRPPFKVGTVAPEFTRIAMTPKLFRMVN